MFSDWRFLVFAGTVAFNIGAIWAQWTASKQNFIDMKGDVRDLKVRVLNGISSKLAEHTDRLTRIETTCAGRHETPHRRKEDVPQRRSGDEHYGIFDDQ